MPPEHRPPVADRFVRAVEAGALDLPLPGSGQTGKRWAGLQALGEDDPVLARLGEGHADALAILAELGGASPPGARWGVWAAAPASLTATLDDAGWWISGDRPWCSGAEVCTHALVTAAAPDGIRLFAVANTGTPLPGTLARGGHGRQRQPYGPVRDRVGDAGRRARRLPRTPRVLARRDRCRRLLVRRSRRGGPTPARGGPRSGRSAAAGPPRRRRRHPACRAVHTGQRGHGGRRRSDRRRSPPRAAHQGDRRGRGHRGTAPGRDGRWARDRCAARRGTPRGSPT